MKFKIGDKVVGNEASNEEYDVTCKKRGFIGEVIAMNKGGYIVVKVLSVDNNSFIGEEYWVEPEYFEKVGEKIKKTIPEKSKKIYLASPFFNDTELLRMTKVLGCLRNKGLEVFAPYENQNKHLEFGSLEWRRATFESDINAIDNADVVVAIVSNGNYSDSGTCWECSYAYAKGIPVVVVNFSGKEINLMISDSLHAYISAIEELEEYNFDKMEKKPYTDYVW